MVKTYWIRSDYDKEFLFGQSNIKEEYERIKCSKTKMHWRLGKRLTKLDINIPKSKVDLVWTGVNECLISDKLLNLFKENNISGFTVYPAKVTYKNSEEKAPEFWELIVTGWGGIAPESSGIKIHDYCEDCDRTKYTKPTHPEYLFDENLWDGSDFFMIWPMPGLRMVTQKVIDLLERNKIEYYVKIPVEEIKFTTNTMSPGRLRNKMPEERAREIGEPLGIY